MSIGSIQLPKPISTKNVGNTAIAILTTQGMVHGLVVVNQTAAEAFLQIYDTAQASVVVGTAVSWWVPIPASGGVVIPLSPAGFQHFNAVSIAACTTPDGNTAALCDVTMFVK